MGYEGRRGTERGLTNRRILALLARNILRRFARTANDSLGGRFWIGIRSFTFLALRWLVASHMDLFRLCDNLPLFEC